MREELRIYGVFEPINAEVDSGWLPRNFGLSLAIKRASPSRIRQSAREEPRDCVEPLANALGTPARQCVGESEPSGALSP